MATPSGWSRADANRKIPPLEPWILREDTLESGVRKPGANRIRPDRGSVGGVSWLVSRPRKKLTKV